MLKGIQQLRKLNGNVGKGALVCLAESGYPLDRETAVVPLSSL
jgi:hypothetical protein